MKSSILEDAYATKRPDYYDQPRSEMVDLVPGTCKHVLEVGCGTGAFGEAVKARIGTDYWGVEPEPIAARIAQGRVDRVFCGLFADNMGLPADFFDCVVFNDVLEHMSDPGQALTYAKRLLRGGGVVVASIPNIRHFPTVWRLVIHGEWEYTERGILDRTHLRFFTRSSIRTLFESLGYKVDTLYGIDSFYEMVHADRQAWRYYRIISGLAHRWVEDMRYLRFAVRATMI